MRRKKKPAMTRRNNFLVKTFFADVKSGTALVRHS